MTPNPTEASPSEASDLLSVHYLNLSLLIVFVSTLAQVGALACGAVIDDLDLLYNPARRGCGSHPLECFQHPVFGLYYRPLMTATFAAGVAFLVGRKLARSWIERKIAGNPRFRALDQAVAQHGFKIVEASKAQRA